MKTITEKVDSLLEELLYCDLRNNIGIDKAKNLIRLAIKEQDRDTRYACIEAVSAISESVVNQNSFRGKVNQPAQFACEMLEKAASDCHNVKAW